MTQLTKLFGWLPDESKRQQMGDLRAIGRELLEPVEEG